MATTRNSAQWVALRMLRYLGVTSLDPKPDTGANPDDNKTYLAEGDLDEIASIQTAALQDIFDDGPAQISNVSTGGSLFAPATITLDVTQGSVAAVRAGGWLPWMVGCSCLVGGDGYVNELVSMGTGNAVTLRRPYLGSTATSVQAAVFGNAIPLDPSVKNVLEPVKVAGRSPLVACPDRETFDRVSGCDFLSGAVQAGWPAYYYVESRFDAAQPSLAVFLRVAPAPQAALPITFRAKLLPPTITVGNLGTSDDDPGFIPPVPGGEVEGIFLPYCLQRLTGSPLFKNDDAKPEIARQFKAALMKLAGYKPQISRRSGLVAFRP